MAEEDITKAPQSKKVVTSNHGTGKIRVRKSQMNLGPAHLPRLAAVAHVDSEHGERQGDPKPRFEHCFQADWLDYITLNSPQSVYSSINKIWSGTPTLLRSAPLLDSSLFSSSSDDDTSDDNNNNKTNSSAWTFSNLAQQHQEQHKQGQQYLLQSPGSNNNNTTTNNNKSPQITVLCSEAKHNRFIECDSLKNIYGSLYHVREPETQKLEMTLPEFVQCATTWKDRRIFTRIPLFKSKVGGNGGTGLQQQLESTVHCPPHLSSSSSSSSSKPIINWQWLESLLKSQKHGPITSIDLELGTIDSLLPARYALQDRLMVQVTGRRRILLISPATAFDGMYPYPTHHPYDMYSMVDLEKVDLGMWPKTSTIGETTTATSSITNSKSLPSSTINGGTYSSSSSATILKCIISPGDVLFIPAYWFVHTQFLEAEDAALSITMAQGATRPPAPDAAALRVSRALEERVAEFEGPSEVRRWLQLIGHGDEYSAIDIGTVKGYKRVVLCQSIRDDVDDNLGLTDNKNNNNNNKSGNMWAVLLPAMCQGRLVPTPWLNINFREPLYLSDKPVRLEDTRTEEEKKYPELFRRKLQAAGWRVPESKSTVPIPGYNMPNTAHVTHS